ncbi:type III secretion protein [Salmonella enterica]|nr:type III secretion protein [Salmonella enterica subsp. enterica serovar Sandiego]EEC0251693.1 type III secretion protein [Salmonella enterica subsp. enterica]EJW2129034.1 type III secretion protein [Salmonella enterica]EEE4266810.1 type III secretion protein [Salmonella enterica subsp. enterica serovar Sandiego]EKT1704966.1 type III secretion protein [Salmonella enterica]
MDLQWQRQIELWLQLMGFRGQASALHLVLSQTNENLYLEQIQGRAKISLCRPLYRQDRQKTLMHLLTLLQPDAGAGIPLQAWLSDTSIWLSAMAPPDSGAEQWAELVRRQRLILDRAIYRVS